MTQDHGAVPGRRARVRQETLRALRAAALQEVRERGAVALSLRSVARRMGMSPAGLYRYVASREDLLTLLITDSYADLGNYVAASIGVEQRSEQESGPPITEAPGGAGAAEPDQPSAAPAFVAGPGKDVSDRLRAVAMAYRSWSVAHPEEFGLLFGDPIPGYAAPPDGPTVVAMRGFAAALAAPVIEAWHEGRITRLPVADPSLDERLAPIREVAGDVPAAVLALLLLMWGRLHGQISLEVFGHHTWAFPEGCEALFAADVESLLSDLGVVESPGDRGEPVRPAGREGKVAR